MGRSHLRGIVHTVEGGEGDGVRVGGSDGGRGGSRGNGGGASNGGWRGGGGVRGGVGGGGGDGRVTVTVHFDDGHVTKLAESEMLRYARAPMHGHASYANAPLRQISILSPAERAECTFDPRAVRAVLQGANTFHLLQASKNGVFAAWPRAAFANGAGGASGGSVGKPPVQYYD
ncbi:hypothetical protein T492DRAFT_402474 [Pavlovales sp. CCMP2436]|nr:hypothetical protein T492DRAFT_402474 [Pavlovales sp. CCMP2436]